MKSKESASSALLALLLAVASVPLTGWVASTLWRWFVVPLGVGPIGICQAIGLSTIVQLFRATLATNLMAKKNEDENQLVKAVVLLVVPFLWLGSGAIAHHFMVSP